MGLEPGRARKVAQKFTKISFLLLQRRLPARFWTELTQNARKNGEPPFEDSRNECDLSKKALNPVRWSELIRADGNRGAERKTQAGGWEPSG
jgi:hypothetical protein